MKLLDIIFICIIIICIVIFAIISGMSLKSDSKKLEKASNMMGSIILILCVFFMLILNIMS